MAVIGIQVIGAVFGLGLLYITFVHLKRSEFTLKEFIAWAALGAVFIVVSLVPSIVFPLAEAINLTRPLDLFIILGFIFLVSAMFYVYAVMRATQHKLELLVRRLALEKRDDKRKGK